MKKIILSMVAAATLVTGANAANNDFFNKIKTKTEAVEAVKNNFEGHDNILVAAIEKNRNSAAMAYFVNFLIQKQDLEGLNLIISGVVAENSWGKREAEDSNYVFLTEKEIEDIEYFIESKNEEIKELKKRGQSTFEISNLIHKEESKLEKNKRIIAYFSIKNEAEKFKGEEIVLRKIPDLTATKKTIEKYSEKFEDIAKNGGFKQVQTSELLKHKKIIHFNEAAWKLSMNCQTASKNWFGNVDGDKRAACIDNITKEVFGENFKRGSYVLAKWKISYELTESFKKLGFTSINSNVDDIPFSLLEKNWDKLEDIDKSIILTF